MKLYYAPGACSIGIHVLLEEIGKPYQIEPVNLREGAQFKPPFTAVSPKAKVPALERDDGSILTEFPVIARWLGRRRRICCRRTMKPISGRWKRWSTPSAPCMGKALRVCSEPNVLPRRPPTTMRSRRRAGRSSRRGSQCSIRRSQARTTLRGSDFSAADTALFYVEFWAAKRFDMKLPTNVSAHFDRMMARPAVQRTLQQEGLN